jgi:hypothetical protein
MSAHNSKEFGNSSEARKSVSVFLMRRILITQRQPTVLNLLNVSAAR